MLKHYRLRDYRFNLVVSVLVLTIFGIIVIGSAKESVQDKQIIGLILGLIIMAITSLIDYKFILKFAWVIYAFNIVLLLLVRFLGESSHGAKRWIKIAGIQFQPSEFTKIFLILFFAYFFHKHREDFNSPITLLKSIVLFAIPIVLVLKQPDLSTSITIVMLFCCMVFISGLSYKYIIGILAVSIPVVAIFLVLIMQPDQSILKGYQYKRIMSWIQPDKYQDSEAYQQINSVIAIGSGQLTGKGLNNDDISSVKNANFISEPQTDFIFAIVGEETGFIGCCFVIGMLVIIVMQCIWIGKDAQDLYGVIICCGMAGLIGFQSFFNMGVTTQMLPNTGLPLPFMSYGLTSLVSLYLGIGLVLNVGLQRTRYYTSWEDELL